VAVVVALVVFAKARAFRRALCFPSLPPFPLFAVARVNFEEEEEEEEASDDDLIGTLDPVIKSAIFSSHLLMISLSLCSLFFSLSLKAPPLSKTNSPPPRRRNTTTRRRRVLLLKEEEEEEEREERRES
jgi:hypothetical protein